MADNHSTLILEAGSAGAERRSQDVAAILGRVAKQPDVARAHAAWDAAVQRFAHVQQRADEVRGLIGTAGESVKRERSRFADEVCGTGAIPSDVSAITAAAALRLELVDALASTLAGRIPRLEVREQLSHAEFLEVFSRELDRAASTRMAATLAALAPTLASEGNLSFDLAQTLSGQLQLQATQRLEEAETLRQQASEIISRLGIVLGEN
jgi:hypothetical protein